MEKQNQALLCSSLVNARNNFALNVAAVYSLKPSSVTTRSYEQMKAMEKVLGVSCLDVN